MEFRGVQDAEDAVIKLTKQAVKLKKRILKFGRAKD